jgi:mono/diheme cytochrome c family protein
MSARYRTLFTAIALSLAACADDSQPVEGRDDNVQVEDSAVAEQDAASEVDAAVAVEPDAAVEIDAAPSEVDAAVPVAVDASVVDAAPAVDAAVVPVESQLPCDVEEVLATHCQKCHGATAKNGVPLLTRDNLLKASPKYPTDSVITRVLVRSAAVEMPMPPVGKGEPLTEEDRAVLEAWVNAQSPAGNCE